MKYLICLLSFLFCFNLIAGFTDADKAQINLNNLYTNGGAEQGLTGWSETGGGTLSLEKTVKRSGKNAIKFISSDDGDFLNFPSVTVKKGTNNCESTFYYKTTGTTYKGKVYYGANEVATLDLPSNTEFQKAPITFVCSDVASAYTTKVTNETGTIYVDDGEIGEYKGIGSVNQSPKAYDANAGDFTLTSSNSTNFTLNQGLVTFEVTTNNKYFAYINVVGSYSPQPTQTSNTFTFTGMTFKATSEPQACAGQADAGGSLGTIITQVNSNASTISIYHSSTNIYGYALTCKVELTDLPAWATQTAASQVVRAENANQFGAIEWTNVSGCQFSAGAGNVLGDADCNAATRKLGIAEDGTADQLELKVSNLRPGIYKITPYGYFGNGSGGTFSSFDIYDGTTAKNVMFIDVAAASYASSNVGVAYFNYDSLQTTRTFQVRSSSGTSYCYADSAIRTCGISIEPVYPTSNMHQIINSVYSQFMGQTRVVYGVIAADGSISKTGSGDWASTKDNTGQYHITFTPVFTSTNYSCLYNFQGNGNYGYTTVDEVSNSTASIAYYGTRNSAGDAADRPVTFTCTGNK